MLKQLANQISFILVLLFSLESNIYPQGKVNNGPEFLNENNSKIIKIINGDENSFYTFRLENFKNIESFYIDKFDKLSQQRVFTVNFPNQIDTSKIVNIKYSQKKVYIFTRLYNKEKATMQLNYQTISEDGIFSDSLIEIVKITTDHYEFIDFEVIANPKNDVFLVKVCYKESFKNPYKTIFIAIDSNNMTQLWDKIVAENLRIYDRYIGKVLLSNVGLNLDFDSHGFVGYYFDDNNNIYYAYVTETASLIDKSKQFKLNIAYISDTSASPKLIEFSFEDDYKVKDIKFIKTTDNKLAFGGFLKIVHQRTGRDIIDSGIFSFIVDLNTFSLVSKDVKLFDDSILNVLESSKSLNRRNRYKIDNIFYVNSETFIVGEQFYEFNSEEWSYDYMDVIIAKFDKNGKFDWLRNIPLRNRISMSYPCIFNLYFSTYSKNNIYIFNNESSLNFDIMKKSNYKPSKFKTLFNVINSNFICTSVSTVDGSTDKELIFKNTENGFFSFIDSDIVYRNLFLPFKYLVDDKHKIFFYTKSKHNGRFNQLNFN
ncbi:MAG: hypothetical protein A2033_12325 [Bacteroidetes bacterium GWA2_31_9]|nr:MAG: hypothetical protein A2033_12325 [Bacteroidetes bacterium GWA2_31_9]